MSAARHGGICIFATPGFGKLKQDDLHKSEARISRRVRWGGVSLIYCSIIHNSQGAETIKLPTER